MTNDSAKKYVFDQGIPGFEHLRVFIFEDIEDIGEELPLKVMRSEEDEHVSFIVANPFIYYPEYEWDLSESAKLEMEIETESELEVWAIMTLRESIQDSTINLQAPVLLNNANHRGRQLILQNSPFGTRAPVIRP
ncbi:flagellar assembly protein FliW [Paenibacillus soyae]|uniref:Flagellar assembly factor FliW n=1 Tax=Paenibacillus soyae TaxID=2969249 RepID=A0A9X2SAI5_9BACL|nr:flagellar assembly protein FliW [Paenibacillus soyae]